LTSEIDVKQNSQFDTQLDLELLISFIENRPILWGNMLDKFSDHNKKRKA
jgi:hypothetical protein